ncbi:hypothetical protein BYT27DRAFT_7197664 [Phlegmacium glaucopus]|nr:hypothetical protein BYT27DRAFT_7197664 [Phlegmacium glaucopus]
MTTTTYLPTTPLYLQDAFFAGASNIGGEFNDIKGNLAVLDRSRHEIIVDTGSVQGDKLIKKLNESARIREQWNRSPPKITWRFVEGGGFPVPCDDEDDSMQSTASTSKDDREEEDHTGPPPPQHPPFMPRNILNAGGNITNTDPFNIRNTNVNDVFNDNSQTYYHGSTPPTNQRRPRKMSIHEESTIPITISLLYLTIMSLVEEKDLQSNSRSPGNGAWLNGSAQVHFQGGFPQHIRNGMDFNLLQHMDPKVRRDFDKLMKYTRLQTKSNAAGNSEENDESDDDGQDSSSHNMESITPRMAKLSINDHMPSSTREYYHGPAPLINQRRPQNTSLATSSLNDHNPSPTINQKSRTYLSLLMTKSNIALQPTTPEVYHPMDSSSPSCFPPYNDALHHSHSKPSIAPHMMEPAMIQFLLQPTQQVEDNGNNVLNNPPPVSAPGFNFPPLSSGGPISGRTINGDLTKYDGSFHQTKLNSFNTENNTTKGSFNDDSVVHSSAKRPGHFLFLGTIRTVTLRFFRSMKP